MITNLFLLLVLLMASVLATEREQARNAVKIICENAIKKNVANNVNNIRENAIQQIDWEDISDWQVPNEQDDNVANNDQDNCPICQEPVNPLENEQIATTCGMHKFHSKCVKPWFEQQAICPLCKEQVKEVQVKYEVNEFLNQSPAKQKIINQQQIINQQSRRLKVAYGIISIISLLKLYASFDQILFVAGQILPTPVIQILRFVNNNKWQNFWVVIEVFAAIGCWRELVQSPNLSNWFYFLMLENNLYQYVVDLMPLPTSKIGDVDAMFRYYKAPDVTLLEPNSIQGYVSPGLFQEVIMFLTSIVTAWSCFKTGNMKSATFVFLLLTAIASANIIMSKISSMF